ncbi:MAG TPA: hypothetical protein VGV64_05340, partial [Thermoplasmata archaeon]|nr:hypothetical protein [Thermoplasmata archaeon]
MSIQGTGFAGSSPWTVLWDWAPLIPCASSSPVTSNLGSFNCSFIAPAAGSGIHSLAARDAAEPVHLLTATYQITSQLTLSSSSGRFGDSITVTGSGFASGSTAQVLLQPGGVRLCSQITYRGGFTCAVSIPNSAPGSYEVLAKDSASRSDTVARSLLILPTPTLLLAPLSGAVATRVTVLGTGFGSGEPFTLTWDGQPVVCASDAPRTDANGSFSCFLFVPGGALGVHEVDARALGSDPTSAGSSFTVVGAGGVGSAPAVRPFACPSTAFPDANFGSTGGTATFSVSGGSVTSSTGFVGDTVTATLTGFTAGCTVYVEWTSAGSSCTVTATSGSFGCSFAVPPESHGSHTFTADDFGGNFVSATFGVLASLTLSPSSGPIGTILTGQGTGYGAASSIQLSVGSTIISGCAPTTDSSGGFNCTGTLPTGVSVGSNAVLATDGGGAGNSNINSVSFTVTTATLSLAPASGPMGTLVTLTGSGFAPSTTYNMCLASSSSATGCAATDQFTSDGTGNIPSGTTLTFSASSNQWVAISEGTSSANFVLSTAFTSTTASLTLTPAVGPSGTLYTVTGSGYAPSTSYLLCTQSTATSCSSGLSFTTTSGGAIPSATTTTLSGSAGSSFWDVSQGTASANFIISVTATITTATLVLSATSGSPTTSISLSGGGYAPSTTYTFCFASSAAACSSGSTFTTASGTGGQSIPGGQTFTVPFRPAGSYFVDISQGSSNFILSAAFSITPSITPPSGSETVGTIITVVGSGFAASSALTFSWSPGAQAVTASCTPPAGTTASGNLSCTFTVPPAVAGGHTLTVTDASSNTASGTVTIAPHLALSPTSGIVGSSVTATGNGFAGTSAMSLVWDGSTPLGGSCASTTTNATGSFTCSFSVPASSQGLHHVAATDASSNSPASPSGYTVDPNLTVTATSGFVGDGVTVRGFGYTSGATVTVSWTGAVAISCTPSTVSASGNWSCSFNVPAVAQGTYTITGSESSGSPSSATGTFTVTPHLIASPTSGPDGTVVTLSGNGFAASTTYTYCLQTTITACGSGSTFSTSAAGVVPSGTLFTLPYSTASASDDFVASIASTVAASAAFTVTTPVLTLTPASGPVNTLVTLTGSGLAPSTSYTACFSSSGTAPCLSGSTFVSTSGGLVPSSVTLTVPASSNSFVDLSELTSSNFIVSAGFTVTTPTLTLSPASGPVNTLVTLSGSGYAPSTGYTACFTASASSACASGTLFTTTS